MIIINVVLGEFMEKKWHLLICLELETPLMETRMGIRLIDWG